MILSNSRIRRLKREASKSVHPRAKLAAMIVSSKKVISVGINKPIYGTSQIPAKFRKWPGAVCAEMDALLKARVDVRGMEILVIRINNSGDLMMAKPCPYCEMYLNHVGIKNVYYSVSNESIHVMRW